MMLKAALRQNGHSVGLILPKEVLTHLGATKGDMVFLTFMTDSAVHLSLAQSLDVIAKNPARHSRDEARTSKNKIKMKKLLAGCDQLGREQCTERKDRLPLVGFWPVNGGLTGVEQGLYRLSDPV